jgi:hypothetical protein
MTPRPLSVQNLGGEHSGSQQIRGGAIGTADL